jgi:hypothetical protein
MRKTASAPTIGIALLRRFPMRLPPHVHAFVLATAFITSLTFVIFAMNLLVGILIWTR